MIKISIIHGNRGLDYFYIRFVEILFTCGKIHSFKLYNVMNFGKCLQVL